MIANEHPVRVDRAEMLRYLGHAGQAIDSVLDQRLQDAARLCERSASPLFDWRVFPLRGDAGALRLEGATIALEGKDIQRHLAGARSCAVLVCTLGLSNERELRRLAATSPADATLFSAAGSALAETLADRCSADILAYAARQGLTCGVRFSPGYGDFPLLAQPQIVRVLNADVRMGISCTECGALLPTKTITALVGLFDRPTKRPQLTCDQCAAKTQCIIRKAGTPCYL